MGVENVTIKVDIRLKIITTTTKYKTKQTKKREFQGGGKVCATLLRSAVT